MVGCENAFQLQFGKTESTMTICNEFLGITKSEITNGRDPLYYLLTNQTALDSTTIVVQITQALVQAVEVVSILLSTLPPAGAVLKLWQHMLPLVTLKRLLKYSKAGPFKETGVGNVNKIVPHEFCLIWYLDDFSDLLFQLHLKPCNIWMSRSTSHGISNNVGST